VAFRTVSRAVVAGGLAFTVAFFGARSTGAQTPVGIRVEARPSTANPALGEVFRVTVRATAPSGTQFDFPPQVVADGIELSADEPSAEPGVFHYKAQLFALGDAAAVPPITVRYARPDGTAGDAETKPFPLRPVSSLDPGEQEPAPAGFTSPVEVTLSRVFWIVNGPLALIVLALLFRLIRRLVRRMATRPLLVEPPQLTPEEEAFAALDRLEASAAASTTRARGFYIDLMHVAKRYLGRRLEAPVPEMTTQETLAFARGHALMEPHAVRLRDVAFAADLAKFGGGDDATLASRHVAEIRAIVQTVSSFQTPPPSEPLDAATEKIALKRPSGSSPLGSRAGRAA
jgi:hypothetical protein